MTKTSNSSFDQQEAVQSNMDGPIIMELTHSSKTNAQC